MIAFSFFLISQTSRINIHQIKIQSVKSNTAGKYSDQKVASLIE